MKPERKLPWNPFPIHSLKVMDVSPCAKIVLIYLAARTNYKGETCVGVRTIARELMKSQRFVVAGLKELREKAYMRQDIRGRKGGEADWKTLTQAVLSANSSPEVNAPEEFQGANDDIQGANSSVQGATNAPSKEFQCANVEAEPCRSIFTPNLADSNLSDSNLTESFSVSHSVNHGTSVPQVEDQDTDKPSDSLTPEEEAVMNSIGCRSDIPRSFGINYFHDGHLADLTRIAKVLRSRNRSDVWLAQLVHWAKGTDAKDREANFWKRRLQTGDKGITKLAEYLETGTIAEQFDAKLYARKPDALEVVRGESNDLLIYDGVWVEKQRLGDAYVAPPEYECACGNHCKGFCKLECEMEMAE
jgi:hypothetical protein